MILLPTLFLFISIVLQISSCYTFNGYFIRDLEGSDLTSEAGSWTFSAYAFSSSYKTTTTNSYNSIPSIMVLGGPWCLASAFGSASGHYMERIYTGIQTHNFVAFTFRLWYFDNWSPRNGLSGVNPFTASLSKKISKFQRK